MAKAKQLSRTMANQCVAMRARRISRVVTRIYDDALRPHGVTAAQLNQLVAISMHGEARPTALAEVLELEKSTLSRNLQRLEASGWIRTGPAPDGRGNVVALTDGGAELIEAVYPAWRAAQKRARAELGAAQFDALADKRKR